MCNFEDMISAPPDPLAHLRDINEHLLRCGIRMHIKVDRCNAGVTYREERVGEPPWMGKRTFEDRRTIVHSIYTTAPSSDALLSMFQDLMYAIRPGHRPEGIVRNADWMFAGNDRVLFAMALDQGITWEKAECLDRLPIGTRMGVEQQR